MVLLASIFIFAGLFPLLPRLSESGWLNQVALIGIKVLCMLPIAGLSYEVIRLAGKREGRGIWPALLWPGLQLQRLTTREPTDEQIETALVALKAAVQTPEGAAESLSVL